MKTDFSSRQHLRAAMDAISALGTVACILSITEFVTGLLSACHISEVQPSQRTISETIQKLRIALSENRAPSVLQQPPANALDPFSNAAALRELVSFRDTAAVLLEEIEGILRQAPDERRSDGETRALLRSRLVGTPYIEKLEQLSQAVTNQADAILR